MNQVMEWRNQKMGVEKKGGSRGMDECNHDVDDCVHNCLGSH